MKNVTGGSSSTADRTGRDASGSGRLSGNHRRSPSACWLSRIPPWTRSTIVVLEGDETGQELLEEALRVLAPDVIGVELEFPRFDLSLENRRTTQNGVVHEAAAAIREAGLGLKAATITPEGRDDVGSPNRILREEIGGKVIVRTGRRIPGRRPVRRRARADLGRAHGGRRRLRREGVARGRGRRRGRLPHGADRAADLPRGRRVRVPRGGAHRREGLRRPEVHGQPDLRGDAQGGDGRGGRAPPGRPLRAAADRRDASRCWSPPRATRSSSRR